MKRLFVGIALGLMAASSAIADGTNGTSTTSVGASSTTVAAANDVTNGRHFIFLQNLHASQTATCVISPAGTAATATTGIFLAAGASFTMYGVNSPSGASIPLPSGAITCIASGSSTPITVITY